MKVLHSLLKYTSTGVNYTLTHTYTQQRQGQRQTEHIMNMAVKLDAQHPFLLCLMAAGSGCSCISPANFATISCEHNYVADTKVLPANRLTHTHTRTGSSESQFAAAVCVWHSLMTHTSCCTSIAAAARSRLQLTLQQRRLHIFLVIKITLKLHSQPGRQAGRPGPDFAFEARQQTC